MYSFDGGSLNDLAPSTQASEDFQAEALKPSEALQDEFRNAARAAVEAEDARREATVKAAITKATLFRLMNTYKIKQLPIPGRGPIKVISEDKKELTKKALLLILGDERGLDTWNKLPIKSGKESLRIPPPIGEEGESEI